MRRDGARQRAGRGGRAGVGWVGEEKEWCGRGARGWEVGMLGASGTVRACLQDDDGQEGVPRVGLYILQEERCWELLPPEEELEAWIAKLQLVIWGQATPPDAMSPCFPNCGNHGRHTARRR